MKKISVFGFILLLVFLAGCINQDKKDDSSQIPDYELMDENGDEVYIEKEYMEEN